MQKLMLIEFYFIILIGNNCSYVNKVLRPEIKTENILYIYRRMIEIFNSYVKYVRFFGVF
jgi:hypothetical protein